METDAREARLGAVVPCGDAYAKFLKEDEARIAGIMESLGLKKMMRL